MARPIRETPILYGNGLEDDNALAFNVLVKKEGELFIAHCLELDIVATHENVEAVTTDILDLIRAQVSYAFTYKNLDHLYRPAPPEAWAEFYSCKLRLERRKVEMTRSRRAPAGVFVPPWFIAQTCTVPSACHG